MASDWERLPDLFESMYNTVKTCESLICETGPRIDSIALDDTQFYEWLGYAHYVLGSPFYQLFSTVILICCGIIVWKLVMKGFDLLLKFIPFIG